MENNNSIYEEPQGSMVMGILGAALGALIGAVIWALVGMAGYIVSVVGLLTAFLASKGYDLLHGRQGKIKVVVLLVCVILAVLLGNAGTVAMEIHQVYTEEGYSMYITESTFFQLMVPALLEDSDFIGAIIKDSALGLLLAMLGCFGLVSQAGRKKTQPAADQAAAVPVESNVDNSPFGKE
ncbi:MAG: hypothetical protein ACI4O7_07105 [Aristaeellaceae bacterium]